MNIRELDERATPKPWCVSACGEMVAETAGEGNGWHELCDPFDKKQDADLSAHCRNHFLEALDALEDAKAALQHHGHYGDATSLDAKIRKLEKVEDA